MQARVLVAFCLLLSMRVLNLVVPLLYKRMVDTFTAHQSPSGRLSGVLTCRGTLVCCSFAGRMCGAGCHGSLVTQRKCELHAANFAVTTFSA